MNAARGRLPLVATLGVASAIARERGYVRHKNSNFAKKGRGPQYTASDIT